MIKNRYSKSILQPGLCYRIPNFITISELTTITKQFYSSQTHRLRAFKTSPWRPSKLRPVTNSTAMPSIPTRKSFSTTSI